MLLFTFMILVLGLLIVPFLPARILEKRWRVQGQVTFGEVQARNNQRRLKLYMLRLTIKTFACGFTALIYMACAVIILKILKVYLSTG